MQTGRCLKTLEFGGVVKSVAWCPNEALSLVAVTLDNKVTHFLVWIRDLLLSAGLEPVLDSKVMYSIELQIIFL